MSYYRRNLPHWHPEGASIFLTWRLHGTLPRFRRGGDDRDYGRAFRTYDRALDAGSAGPKWLREVAVARCIVDALRSGDKTLKLYELEAFCVMPNHVHVVIWPDAPVARITKFIKGSTARAANQVLGRVGERFWQDESYDHWIRDENEWNRIVHYTEWNPVAAGLVETIWEWPWSSATGASTG